MAAALFTPSDPLACRWTAPAGLVLHFRALGGSVAVLNPESGDTHVLTVEGADWLRAIHRNPGIYPRETLSERPAGQGGSQGSPIADILQQLHRLRLIEVLPGE